MYMEKHHDEFMSSVRQAQSDCERAQAEKEEMEKRAYEEVRRDAEIELIRLRKEWKRKQDAHEQIFGRLRRKDGSRYPDPEMPADLMALEETIGWEVPHTEYDECA